MSDQSTADAPKRIPRFRSLEEEAEFWDTHDSTEFEHLFKPTRLKFAEHVEHVLEVPLPAKTIDELAAVARSQGVPLTELAAEFVIKGLERMRAEQAPRPNKKGKQHG